MKSLKDSLKRSLEVLMDINKFNPPQGITTGYPGFDNLMRGMRKGSLTILASHPSLGKTAFALNIINNLSRKKSESGILFSSDLSHTELTFRLLTIASGIKNNYSEDQNAEKIKRLTSVVDTLRDYPLFFSEYNGMDETFCSEIKTWHAEKKFELLIADNIRPEDCRMLKTLAKELNIAVLALVNIYSKKDDIQSRGIADTLVNLHRERGMNYDPDLGAPVEMIISKNKHGLCGTCRMYFIPQIMLFKESCADREPFVVIPEIYEPITPYGELKKYLSPEKVPLLQQLQAEIPQKEETLNLSDVLSLSARLEAAGDHENAVKVFLLGRKNCHTYEKSAEVVYDWMFAAMYYWLFRDNINAARCMKLAESMLNTSNEQEYRELERRMKTYISAEWIKDHEII